MHLHGGETEPSSDGHPEAWITAAGEKGPKFVKDTHTYHNQQPPATLWYHDHTAGLTTHNVVHGTNILNSTEQNFLLKNSFQKL